ncbi:MAG: alpha/beta fold hydrolase [Actinomycetales bacterium]|nr:alpha/beta fold hydrolase [Actinomycetales bacterium]
MRRSTGRTGPSIRRPRALGAALTALALLAVLPSAAAHAPPTTDSVAPLVRTPTARPAPGPVWTAHVVRAAGVRQWIECAGTGPVTVVVIPGLHATHTMWSRVLPSFAGTTRTCVYDRPGLGPSPGRSPHATVDAGRHAYELMALLVANHVTGPLVVVGHSYGGLVARAFVARYRSHVAGLMLVEGVAPYDRLSHYWGEGGDRVDTWLSSAAAARMRLGSMPLVVEAAQDPDRSYWGGPSYGSTASDIADWRAHQRAAAALSTSSTYLVVSHSAHVIEHDRPDAVVAGLRLLVRSVERRTALPRCALGAYGSQPLCS